MATKKEITANFQGPKSMCVCGHAGDGTGMGDSGSPVVSLHAGLFGHGGCIHGKCKCVKFTWSDWTEPFKRALATASD